MSFVPALRAEAYRAARESSTLGLLLLPLLVALCRMLLALGAARLGSVRRELDGGAPSDPLSGFALLADGLRAGGGALTFSLLILGALALVRDREHGSLAVAFVARARGAVVLAKALLLACFALVSFALLTGGCIGLAAAALGLHGVEVEGVEVVGAGELWGDVARACGATLLPLVGAAWFALAISSIAGSSGGAVAFAIVPFVTFDVVKSAAPDASQFAFATYAPLLADGSALARLVDLARGYANVDWLPNELLHSHLVPLAWAAVFLAAAIVVTRARSA